VKIDVLKRRIFLFQRQQQPSDFQVGLTYFSRLYFS